MQNLKEIFIDNKGEVVIAQFPNLPIIIALLSWIISISLDDVNLSIKFSNLSFSFFLVWSWLEMSYGVNIFRRTLGVLSSFLGCLYFIVF